jgi:hypothetical protein
MVTCCWTIWRKRIPRGENRDTHLFGAIADGLLDIIALTGSETTGTPLTNDH